MCFKIYELDLTHFFSTQGLTWQTVLKKIKVKLIFLTDFDMMLMIKKSYQNKWNKSRVLSICES